MHTRRNFVKLSAMGALASTSTFSLANSLLEPDYSSDSDLKVFIFSKHLQFLDYKGMCEAAKEIGFDGLDLTVRPKGHVLPKNVEEDLPRATEAMKSFDLLPLMLSTNVSDANNPLDRKVLEVASQQGYKYYRPDWYRYNDEQTIEDSLEIFSEKIEGLAQLNKSLNISGSYHNHSGHFMGSSIWDLSQILKGIPPLQMGCQYDIMHATVEGGKNWEIDFRLIKDQINSLVVKDFVWGKVDGKWKPVFKPMGEGMVDFNKYFSLLKKYKINVPVSIHIEYDLGGAEHGGVPTIDKKEIFKKMKKDLLFVREMWENTQ